MLKPEKRIEVAKDVIKQVKVGKYKPTMSTYLREDTVPDNLLDDLQKHCQTIKKCTVCARGSMFISAVAKFNKYELAEAEYGIQDDEDIQKKTEKDWGNKQIVLIESAYMRTYYYDGDSGYTYDEENPAIIKAVSFGKRFKRNSDCLIAIMRNIIRNQGTFKP